MRLTRAVLPIVLAVALVAGCKGGHKPEATTEQPAADPAADAPGHPALNKLNQTKGTMSGIENQRTREAEAAGVDTQTRPRATPVP